MKKHATLLILTVLITASAAQATEAGTKSKARKTGITFTHVFPDNDKLDSRGTGTRAKVKNRGEMFDTAYATWLNVRNAVKAGELDKGRELLDALWAKYPRGTDVWFKIKLRNSRKSPDGTDFGRFPFYLNLIFYDDIIQWRQKNKVVKRKAEKKIDLLILLVKEHHTKVELPGMKPYTHVSKLDPRIKEDDYRHIRTAFSDFDEWVFYLTEGEYNLRLNIVEHKTPTTSEIGEKRNKNGRVSTSPLEKRKLIKQYNPKYKPDWLYLMYPLDRQFQANISKQDINLVPGGVSGFAAKRPYLFGTIEKILYSRCGKQELMSSDERIAWITVWLTHEYMHRVYALSEDLNLEEEQHIYYKRDTWPKDFEGFMHYDYYCESIKKRVHQPGRTPLHEKLVR